MKKTKIKIKTQKEFDALLSQGYKIVNNFTRLVWSKKDDE